MYLNVALVFLCLLMCNTPRYNFNLRKPQTCQTNLSIREALLFKLLSILHVTHTLLTDIYFMFALCQPMDERLPKGRYHIIGFFMTSQIIKALEQSIIFNWLASFAELIVGDTEEAPEFGLVQTWSVWPSGEWMSRGEISHSVSPQSRFANKYIFKK